MQQTSNSEISAETLIRHIPSVLLVFSREGDLANWNNAAAEALGNLGLAYRNLGQVARAIGMVTLSSPPLAAVDMPGSMNRFLRNSKGWNRSLGFFFVSSGSLPHMYPHDGSLSVPSILACVILHRFWQSLHSS